MTTKPKAGEAGSRGQARPWLAAEFEADRAAHKDLADLENLPASSSLAQAIVIGELQEAALDKIALWCKNMSKKWLEWN